MDLMEEQPHNCDEYGQNRPRPKAIAAAYDPLRVEPKPDDAEQSGEEQRAAREASSTSRDG